MRARPGIMLVLAVLLALCADARAFKVVSLTMPEIVEPNQTEAIIECQYEGNLTVVSWFKGSQEFFRYRPHPVIGVQSFFPVDGIGKVEVIQCGYEVCQLRLGGLAEEASGEYRCDIERDVSPYSYATKTATMTVNHHGHWKQPEHQGPKLEGLSKEYKEGEMIHAYCHGGPNSILRWYINGQEIEDQRGSPNLWRKSIRLLFKGVPPKVLVQCVEFRNEKFYGSVEMTAQWAKTDDMKNESFAIMGQLGLLCIFLCLFYLTL